MLSLKNLRNQSAFMTLVNPHTKEPIVNEANTAAQIEVVGMESAEFNDWMLKQTAEKKAVAIDALRYEALCTVVVGWNDVFAEIAKELFDGDGTYTPEKARKLLTDRGYYWICKQLDTFLADRTRFFKAA